MSSSKLTIVDYGMGNIWSVESAMRFLNVQVDISSDPEVISKSECIILPGVGSFKEAMDTVGDSDAQKANNQPQMKKSGKDKDIKTIKGSTAAGTKPTPVDTTPEVDYKN